MTEFSPTVRARLLTATAIIALASSRLDAQQSVVLPLSLGDAARLAAQQSAQAQGARLRADQAGARVRERRADLLPTISSYVQEAGRTFNTSTLGIDFPATPGEPPLFDPRGQVLGPINTLDVRGRVQQNLLDFGALGRVRSAQAAARSSNADADASAEQAATVASTAYIKAMRADADLHARQADTLLATDLLGIARAQLQAGTGVALDVTRARAQLAATRSSLIASRNARDHAHLDLLRALSLTVGTDIVLTDSLSLVAAATEPIPDEAALLAQALRARPDILAEEARVRAAQQGLSAIKAERLPTLGLVADDGVIGKNGARLLNTYTWGLQLSIPIFDGFAREARVQEQRSVVKEAEIRQRDVEQQAQADVRGAVLDLAAAREELDAASERLRLAEQELAQARDRFNAGVAGNADVVNASLALTASRTLVNDAETAYQLARVSLARATGSVTTLR
jgi:outer membrane protein TolC